MNERAVGDKIFFKDGMLPPDEDAPQWTWSCDLRTITPFDRMGSNHVIENNLVLAGVLTPLPKGMLWHQAPFPKTDTEYSQFWIYFESEQELTEWLSNLLRYRRWLNRNMDLSTLARKYKELDNDE